MEIFRTFETSHILLDIRDLREKKRKKNFPGPAVTEMSRSFHIYSFSCSRARTQPECFLELSQMICLFPNFHPILCFRQKRVNPYHVSCRIGRRILSFPYSGRRWPRLARSTTAWLVVMASTRRLPCSDERRKVHVHVHVICTSYLGFQEGADIVDMYE